MIIIKIIAKVFWLIVIMGIVLMVCIHGTNPMKHVPLVLPFHR